MYIYEEAMARYAGSQIDNEIEAAMVAVQDKHHNRLVNEVVGLLHEELMEARCQEETEISATVPAAKRAAIA